MIEIINVPLDSELILHEPSHKYFYNGDVLKESISNVSSQCDFSSFAMPRDWSARVTSESVRRLLQQENPVPKEAPNGLESDFRYNEEQIDFIVESARVSPKLEGDTARFIGNLFHKYVQAHCDLKIYATSEIELNAAYEMTGFEKIKNEIAESPYTKQASICAANLCKFVDANLTPIKTELKLLYKPDLGGAYIPGSCDLVAMFEGNLTVVDWKGVKRFEGIKNSHLGQLFAYSEALLQCGNPIETMLLVRINRNNGKIIANKFRFQKVREVLKPLFEAAILISRFSAPINRVVKLQPQVDTVLR